MVIRQFIVWGLGAVCVASLFAQDAPKGLLIEAENYARKVPDDPAFATPGQEPAASGRVALARFFAGEYVVYDFQVPEQNMFPC